MNTEYILLGLYGTLRIDLDQVCEAIGMKKRTAYNKRCAGSFPIPMSGDPLSADVRDVAAYLDATRNATKPLEPA